MTSRPNEPAPIRATTRLAFCPLCGSDQAGRPANTVSSPEQALCPGRCTAAWGVLEALRASESASSMVADRRRRESESRTTHAPVLSEVLLRRWRDGDWSLEPDQVARLIPPSR